MDAILACSGGDVLDTGGVQKSQGAWGTGDCLAIGLLARDCNCATLCVCGWPGLEGPGHQAGFVTPSESPVNAVSTWAPLEGWACHRSRHVITVQPWHVCRFGNTQQLLLP